MPVIPHHSFARLSLRTGGLLVLLLLSALFSAMPLQAQAVATLRPDPAQLELMPGETAALEIRLENARNLYGIDMRLAFDPAVLEIIDADPSQSGAQMAPGTFPTPDLIAFNAADNAAGTARYVVTQLNPTPPATGSGIVLTVQVRARAAGLTDLTIPLVEMSDRDGNLLAVNAASSSIEVRGDPAAATGIPLLPPNSGASGESAAPATPTATDTPTNASTNDALPESPPSEQAAPGATPLAPVAPEATTEVQPGAGETGVVEAGGSGAVVAEGEVSEAAVMAGEATETVALQGETGASQEEATAAIGAAVSSLQAGEASAESVSQPPSAAPQVIGDVSNPPATAPDEVSSATESTGGRPSSGMVIAVVAVLVILGLLLARLRRRGRATVGPND